MNINCPRKVIGFYFTMMSPFQNLIVLHCPSNPLYTVLYVNMQNKYTIQFRILYYETISLNKQQNSRQRNNHIF